jgi:hypothetical protein
MSQSELRLDPVFVRGLSAETASLVARAGLDEILGPLKTDLVILLSTEDIMM